MAEELGVPQRVHLVLPLEGEAKWAAYRDADVFVLPSQNENFGNTAAEAVAAGTPVIVTENCGIAPLLKGKAGLVVKHDEADLRNALQRVMEDNGLRQILKGGSSAVLEQLDWNQPLAEMEYIYYELAREHAP
jgi:glycosyltransferase involved in cell wall biosynthesis